MCTGVNIKDLIGSSEGPIREAQDTRMSPISSSNETLVTSHRKNQTFRPQFLPAQNKRQGPTPHTKTYHTTDHSILQRSSPCVLTIHYPLLCFSSLSYTSLLHLFAKPPVEPTRNLELGASASLSETLLGLLPVDDVPDGIEVLV